MNIRDWLETLGLAQYAAAFEANDIDSDLLPHVDDQLLKDIGIASAGHRLRIRTAIQKLSSVGAAPLAVPETHAGDLADAQQQSLPPTGTPTGAERRQLTVMFCDLVGSVALSQRLDPEELRALIQAYRQACAAVIERYEGHIARYVGDGILSYFGWPKAHEDDAERSLRAALEIVTAVKAVPASPALSVHIGIATGPVVVGEQAGESPEAKLAVGTTPNLAARLQGLARTDEVVIAASTRCLVGNTFELADLGDHVLKGIADPVTAFRVAGLAQREGRFEASRGESLTPLIGREEELGLLWARWQLAAEGEGQVVALCGEPGIGKSRMTRGLRERLRDRPHLSLRYQCSPYHSGAALYPVIDQLERAARFVPGDSVEQKLDKLEALLAQGGENVVQCANLIASLLSLPAGRYPPLAYAPQRQQDLTLAALLDFIEALARKQPLLLVFEDAHWIDPITQELLDLLVPRLASLAVLLLLTHRPEYAAPWPGQSHVTAHLLNRLSRRQAAEMTSRIAGGKALPPALVEQIVSNTDGVPLFIEELTKSLLESSLLRLEDDAYQLEGALSPLAIPATLKDSLMARLDRLGTAKELAQIGACIGREFSHRLLAAVSGLGEAPLQAGLNALLRGQLIFRQSAGAQTKYVFKHALVQDTAYESLLKSRRHELHQRLAYAMIERFSEEATGDPALVAHHFTAAGLDEPAAQWWHRAAQRARQKLAIQEAIGHYRKALQCLNRLPESRERDSFELTLQLEFGSALNTQSGWAETESGCAFERAHALYASVGSVAQGLDVLFNGGAYHFVRGNLDQAYAVSSRFLEEAQHSEDLDMHIAAEFLHGIVLAKRGAPQLARRHLERAIELHGPGCRQSMLVRPGQDVKASATAWLCWQLWWGGRPEQSHSLIPVAAQHAQEFPHPSRLAWALITAGICHALSKESQPGLMALKQLREVSTEHGFAYWEAIAEVYEGVCEAYGGRETQSITIMRRGMDKLRAMGSEMDSCFSYCVLGEIHLAQGSIAEAAAAIEAGLTSADRRGEHDYDGELFRLRGELLLVSDSPDPEQAQAWMLRGMELAREQQAKMIELRAACSLARLWRSQGKAKQARELLAQTYAWFTEGFDTKDLKEAKALLDDLQD